MNLPENKQKIFSLIAFIAVVTVIPFTVYLAKTRQEIRQRAQVSITPPSSCQAVSTDTLLIIDRSGSMEDDNKLVKAKQAANLFIDKLSTDSQNKVGLVSFSNDFILNAGLTSDFQSIKNKIDTLNANGGTCTRCGIKGGNDQISANGRQGIKKVAILLTDGLANMVYNSDPGSSVTPPIIPTITPRPTSIITPDPTPEDRDRCRLVKGAWICSPEELSPDEVLGETAFFPPYSNTKQVEPSIAEQIALNAAKQGNVLSGTVFYTIGLGADVNGNFLRELAHVTGGEYFFARDADQLDSIYQQIYQVIGRGSVSGSVYNDANGNGVFDIGEEKLQNWTVDLKSGSTNAGSANTGTIGDYNISNLCDGNYDLSQQIQSGFIQTEPANSSPYSITIQNGGAIANKNFGNKRSETPIPSEAPSITPSVTPTAAPSVSPSVSPKVSPSVSPSPSASPSISVSPSPVPGGTVIELDLNLQSIGSESGTSLNNNPKNPTRRVKVELFNSADTSTQALVGILAGNVRFDSTSGTFKGEIPVPGNIGAGVYSLKVVTGKYLKKIAGRDSRQPLQQIVIGQPVRVPQTMLIVGDINGDNSLNIDDWHIWRACFNKGVDVPVPLRGIESECGIADLNDDGENDHQPDSKKGVKLNMRDYQWLFNSFQVQTGD